MSNHLKYFFNRSFELLHYKTFDSYRVSLHNPITIFEELYEALENYDKKKIKHFDPTITDIGEEALSFLKNEYINEIVIFGDFSKKQILNLFEKECVKSKKDSKKRSLSLISKAIIENNRNFKEILFDRIIELLLSQDDIDYVKLDNYISWLITQMLHDGFSRKYLERRFRRGGDEVFKNINKPKKALENLKDKCLSQKREYEVIFKINDSGSNKLKITDERIKQIGSLPLKVKRSQYINESFKTLSKTEEFFQVDLKARDFWSAIFQANIIICEFIEMNTLGDSERSFIKENQAICIYKNNGKTLLRMDTITEQIDGFYEYNEIAFNRFVENYVSIKSTTAKEKISSAIRFYKLGDESVELEHKILNYWIGFEQLFSSIGTKEDSIKRMKSFFIKLNCIYYLQRRTNYLISRFEKIDTKPDQKGFEVGDLTHELEKKIKHEDLIITNPLNKSRLLKYLDMLGSNQSMKKILESHKNRLNQHLTRVYSVRNQIAHEGSSHVNLTLISGHLRHYLVFSIEQITNELNENSTLDHLDDVFIYYENIYDRIMECNNIQEVFSVKDYQGYME